MDGLATVESSSKSETTAAAKKSKPTTVLSTSTHRSPTFTFLHLSLVRAPVADYNSSASTSAEEVVDDITARTYLTRALNQFLGITGTAIAVDILKCEGRDVWIRVPHPDGSAVIEAASGWVGSDVAWRVKGSGTWLGGLNLGNGRDLFDD